MSSAGRVGRAVARVVAALWAVGAVGLFLIPAGAGCSDCDAEARCLQKEGLVVQDEIYPMCGVDPTFEGDRYTWATEAGDCSCTLESGTIGGYNWRGCAFERK